MPLEIATHGIVQRRDDSTVHDGTARPCGNAGPVVEIEVPAELADRYRLWTGDIVKGDAKTLEAGTAAEDVARAERPRRRDGNPRQVSAFGKRPGEAQWVWEQRRGN